MKETIPKYGEKKRPFKHTLQEINIFHLGKRKFIFKSAIGRGYVSSQEEGKNQSSYLPKCPACDGDSWDNSTGKYDSSWEDTLPVFKLLIDGDWYISLCFLDFHYTFR